jgi:hypothetical protein
VLAREAGKEGFLRREARKSGVRRSVASLWCAASGEGSAVSDLTARTWI